MRLKLLLILWVCVAAPAGADSFADDVSDATFTVVGVAAALPALGGSEGFARAARRYDGLLVALTLTDFIKDNVHAQRPDGTDARSFPSGHTAAAFALAGALGEEHPKQKWLYIGLAALVGWSRVELDKHYWHDVVAGAAIGYASGRWSAGSETGILIGRVFRW